MKTPLYFSIAVVAMLLTACSYPGLFFTEHTHLGAQIKLSATDSKPLDVAIGYDRGILTVVPRVQKGGDAAAVLSKTDVGLTVKEKVMLKNVFASGAAAKILTEDPETAESKLKALFDPSVACLVSSEVQARRKNAWGKLQAIRTDQAKVNDLYKRVFPKGTVAEGDRFEALHARLADICDRAPDLEVLKLYEGVASGSNS